MLLHARLYCIIELNSVKLQKAFLMLAELTHLAMLGLHQMQFIKKLVIIFLQTFIRFQISTILFRKALMEL